MCCFDEKTPDTKKQATEEGHKEQMWEKMMDCCCSDMTDEEKQKWIHHMHECGGPMMGAMMGKMHGKAVKSHLPWDMCKEMMSSIRQNHKIATMATPEVQGLFEDWVEEIEQEYPALLDDELKQIFEKEGFFYQAEPVTESVCVVQFQHY